MKYALLLACGLTGCTTTGEVATSDEASKLKCVGYCDLVITDRNVELRGEVEIKEEENDK